MRKTYYYFIVSVIFALFFSTTANANTFISTTVPVSNGTSLTVSTEDQTISGEVVEVEDISGTYTQWWKFEPIWNISLSGVNQQWLNGYIQITIQISPSDPLENTLVSYEFINVEDEGLKSYIIPVDTSGKYRIMVFFDNYYNRSNNINIGQIKLVYRGDTAYTYSNSEHFITTISTYASNVEKSVSVINDRLTALLYSAITQSIGQVLQDIDTWTNYIYNKVLSTDTNVGLILQDLESYITFMQTYIPNLSTISTNTANIYSQLQTIYSYISDRATVQYNFVNGAALTSGNQIILNNQSNYKHVIFSKDQNIEYIYFNAFTINSNWHIIYLTDLPDLSGTYPKDITQYVSRTVRMPKAGLQYYPIDFQYNEKYVLINFGSSYTLKAYIGDGYTYQAIMYYLDYLTNMNAEQSSAAEEIESQYADRESQSSQLINGLGSLVMPSISSGDLDIMSSVDQTQKINFFGLIGLITHNELVTKIMIIIVLGAIVGYILYGKK